MERKKQIMNRFTNKILMLSALLAAFAIAPMASYGQSKVEEPKNVNVINTPNVTVSNTPKVLNANDSNIFQETRLKNGTNDPQEVFSYAVPAGKRLVIEFVSVNATIGEGEKMHAFIRGGGFTDAIHPIIMNFQVTVASRDLFAGAQLMRMYAEPGTTVEILVSRRDAADTGAVGGNAFIETSISGYLVDVP
jgi:hypothetical protein